MYEVEYTRIDNITGHADQPLLIRTRFLEHYMYPSLGMNEGVRIRVRALFDQYHESGHNASQWSQVNATKLYW